MLNKSLLIALVLVMLAVAALAAPIALNLERKEKSPEEIEKFIKIVRHAQAGNPVRIDRGYIPKDDKFGNNDYVPLTDVSDVSSIKILLIRKFKTKDEK